MLRNEALYPTATRQFLDESRARIRTEDSRHSYSKVLRTLQGKHPGRRVSEFTSVDLVAFCQDGALASSSLAQRRGVLVAFFEWAELGGMATPGISAGLRRIKIRSRPVKHHNWLSPVQVKELMGACDDGTRLGERDSVLVLTGVMTGLRCAELAGLRWGHVNLSERTVSVIGKGEKPAVIGIPARLAEVLFEWRGQCAVGLERPPVGVDPVFPRVRSVCDWASGVRAELVVWTDSIGRGAIRDLVRLRGEQAGIRNLAPHDLRRTFAGLMEEQFDLLTVSKALRHSNVGTTQRYLEQSPRRAIEAGQGFDIAL